MNICISEDQIRGGCYKGRWSPRAEMSGNQKQAPQVVPQARFPQGSDVFHVGNPPYMPQQQPPPNLQGNPGQIRNMGPTGPPNQTPTPPNADLKVPHVQQQTAMNMQFIPRGGTFYRPQGQATGRVMNRAQNQHQNIYPPGSQLMTGFSQVPQMAYFNMAYPQRHVLQNYQLVGNQLSYQYPHAAPPAHAQYFQQFNAINVQRQPPTPQVPPMQQNMGHPPQQNVSISSSPQPNNQNNKTRPNAIPIIDPKTNIPVKIDDSSPLSRESSACQTPQPAEINSSKEVQAIFAKKVAQSLSDEVYPNCILEYDGVAPQGSKLQVPKKEFVPASTIKESFTPVVSAKTNCEERTIVNKPQLKDRESPVKSIRKQKEPTIVVPKENKEVKEKEISVEKPVIQEIVTENPPVLPPSTTPPAPVVSSPSVIKEIKEKENIVKEEKKCVKKDKMDSNKLVVNSSAQEVTQEQPAVIAPTVVPTVQQPDAKTKQTPHMKEVPKQSGTTQTQNLPKTQMMKAAPPLQPAKQINKVIKEVKGTNKEATEMETLTDNIDNNIISTPAAVTSDKNTPISVNNQEMNKASKADEPVTINTVKPEMNAMPKPRIDVTDIVKEKPRPFVAPAPVESKDETDKASVTNEKIVQAKNEMNAKNIDTEEPADAKSVLPYKENQWSPYNKDGKKQYEKDFLIALRNFPMSKQKPDNILNEIVAQDDKSRLGDVSRYGGRNDFAPSFGGGCNFSGKSTSQRGVPTKRGSQQGKIGGGGGSKGGKSGSTIRVSISIKEDVKLHETENAWKPARMNSTGGVQSDDDKKTAELYRKVRGVLNKLTPQKFATLIDQIKSLPIDTTSRLQGVIDLVFEKAVDEPNFSVAYALMCKELALMEVPVSPGSSECVNFRKLLITRCQVEFERNSYEETTRNEKLKEIGECTDPEKKKELTLILDDDDRRLRRKSVGNIRFIGELFKQQMLTVSIMMRCLYILLENKDEERLECLCKLLSTVGKELENRKVGLNDIFSTMKEIADKNSNNKISSRVRFMLQDVIDLRLCSWVPRRQDLNPKTMDQIQKEAVNEQLTSQALNSGPITPRKEDSRGMNSNFGDRKQRGNARNTGEDGWSTATTRGKSNMPFVQSDKLKIKQPNIEEPFGSAIAFGNWARGSNAKIPQVSSTNTATNMFAALAVSGDHDSRTGGHRSSSYKDSYNAKGSSLDRISFKQYDGHGSRSGSQHRSNDNSHSNTPSPAQQVLPPSKPPMRPEQPEIKKVHKEVEKKLDEQARTKLINQLKSTLDEYTGNFVNLKECVEDFMEVPTSELDFILDELFNYLLDKSNDIRKKCGGLFAHLIISKILPLESFAQIIETSFSYYEDVIVDIPNLWECYAQLISGSLIENAMPLKVLFEKSSFLISKGVAHKLIASTFKFIVTEKGPNFLNEIWKSSGLKLSDFMDPNEVDKFVDTNNLGILSGKDGTTSSVQNISFPEIGNKLRMFIKDCTSLDDIKSWVNANVGEGIKDKEFIKVLVTAVIENSVNHLKLDVDTLRRCFNLLLFYIDGNQEYELQCLYAIHSLVNKWEYPQGLLLKIFGSLYDESIISYEGFIAWRTNDGPAGQDRKGVAVKQLNSFFTQLCENDDEFTSDEELQK
ncbi:PREDICTED: eukaryotic translation initiation factor 4 gamma 3-like isoform X2 [Nicrophorus vespilloides]|uniref:Eukaryotic translation initiation factor 4 gamma 3-like isoform X2 n=1 Tax=Nicrophorus vespilloides TaxID=110193 RepID=A0ABM1M928_NICVS|nr:PREDICTED: eukaryotic translation initiation factor 4 gamma 3-like isoform X2 [Nicrophorus vespilloides]